MTDPIQQQIDNMHNAEDNQAARDEVVDQATTQAMTELTAIDLWGALENVDIGDVNEQRFKPDSAEDYFHDLLTYINLHAKAVGTSDEYYRDIGIAVERLVFLNVREEVEDTIG